MTLHQSDGQLIFQSVYDSHPAYVIAAAAKRLIEAGHSVSLPDGYSPETLAMITWATGHRGQRIAITIRQAEEVAQLGRTLLNVHRRELTLDEEKAVALLGRAVSRRT